MPIQLFKVAKRGPDKLIHELSDIGSGRSMVAMHNNSMATTISLAFGHNWGNSPSNKHVVRGTADEFALLVSKLAEWATCFEGKGPVYHTVPAAEKIGYAVAWLRAIADKLENPVPKVPEHQIKNAKTVLRLLRLGNAIDALPGETSMGELCQEASEITGISFADPGIAIEGLRVWIEKVEGVAV